jgi:tetratricopeptide (TPR) repeat protein
MCLNKSLEAEMVSPRWYIVLLAVLPLSATVFAQSSNPALKPLTSEQRGDILMARKMYREAIEMYAQEKPVTAVLRNKTGIAYHQLLQFELARKHYEMAVKLDRNYAEALNNLGTVYYARKNYRRAISQYKRALRVAPQSASIYSNLGTAYFARKDYKLAAETYQKAVSLDPEVFEHRGSFGVILQERTVEERAKFHYYLARTYAKAGQIDRALQYIRKALEEGFTERKKIMDEPAFVALHEMQEFKELVASEPRVL